MSKVFGLFVLKYTKPLLDPELQALIIRHLKSTQISYILNKYNGWDYQYMSAENIPVSFIVKNINKPWCFTWLSDNYNIPLNFIITSNKNWNYNRISARPDIKIEHILACDKWNYHILSANPCIVDYLDYPVPWDHDGLSKNPGIKTLKSGIKWNYKYLSTNPNLINYIFDHPEIPWDYSMVSSNPAITIKDLERKLPWDYRNLSANPAITISDVLKNPESWDYDMLLENPSIKISDILSNPDLPWDYELVSMRYDLKTEDIIPGKPWDYRWLIKKPNINIDKILAASDFPFKSIIELTKKAPTTQWNYNIWSKNTNVPIKYILATDFPWNYDIISSRSDLTLEIVLTDKPWNLTELMLNPVFSTKEKLIICEKFD